MSPRQLWRLEFGEHVPRPALMSRIYLLTGGQVQPNDFYDLPEIVTAEPLSDASAPFRRREDAA